MSELRLFRGGQDRSVFFFQAEDGIRDYKVTGVQTCALPIWRRPLGRPLETLAKHGVVLPVRVVLEHVDATHSGSLAQTLQDGPDALLPRMEIGRASCRERV